MSIARELSTVARTHTARHEVPLVLWAGVFIGTAAMLICGAQPIVLGGLVEVGRLTEAGVGRAFMAELVGIGIGSSIGPFVMNGGMRWKATASSAVLVLIDVAIYQHPAPLIFMIERGAAGLFEGLLLGVTSQLLTHTRRPVRWNGVMMAVSLLPQIANGYLMPSLIIPKFGIDACFLILAGWAGVSVLCSLNIVDRVEGHPAAVQGRVRITPPLVIFVLAVLLQNICMGGVWGYIEQLAHQRHFSPNVVGIAVGGSLAMMGLGSAVAAVVADRIPPLNFLIAAVLVQGACTLWIIFAMTPAFFVTAIVVVGLTWTSVVSFCVGESVALDPTRRVALMNVPMNLASQGIGPLLVSFVVKEGDVLIAYWLSTATFALAATLYVLVRLCKKPVSS